MTELDHLRFREVMGHYPTGVVLVTAVVDGEPVGMIVGSFTSVSLDPPLVAYLPTTTSTTFARLREAEVFCVNVLSAEQEPLCRRMASRADDKWAGVGWEPSAGGAPIIDGAVAWLECGVHSIAEAGDHYLVMGHVRDMDVLTPETPLLFFQGGYGRFTLSSLVASSSPDLVMAIRLAEVVREDVEELSHRLGVGCDVIAAVGQDLVFVGAAGTGDELSTGPILGSRIPLMAPLGEQYVAWAGEQAAARWIERSGARDADTQANLMRRLEKARIRGFSMSRIPADQELDFYSAVRAYTDSDHLTPAQERGLRGAIVAWSRSYDPVDVVPEETYEPHSLAVAVLDSQSQPLLILRLTDLPHPAPGEQIIDWVRELRVCSARVSAKVDKAARRA